MGVTSVSRTFSSANWTSSKPEDYKGTGLDKALQAWEGLAKQKVEIPKDLIPAPPACKAGALKDYVGELKKVLAELEKGKGLVNQFIGGLNAVQAAGGKTAAELIAAAKAKGVDEQKAQKYQDAASQASSIASAAAAAMKSYQ